MANSKSLARRLSKGAMAVGLLIASTGVATSPTDERAIDQFIDCTDSFWIVTCGFADLGPALEQGPPVQIDNDAVCIDTTDDKIMCHT